MRNRLVLAIPLFVALTVSAYALPRFASQMNLSCQSCHVNPLGGGMRNAFGQSFGRDSLAVKNWAKDFNLDDFSPKITDYMSYGADVRFLAFYQSKTNPGTSSSSFFPMQTDLYFNFTVSKKISLYLNPAFGPYNRLEAFGIAKVLPANGYFKFGRFTPPYGLRLDDHTSFVRQSTPFRNNMGQQTGIELGLNPGPVTIMGALTNGIRGDLDAATSKAVYGKLEAHGALGPLNLLGGISSYNDASGLEKINLLGGYGAVSLCENLTLMGDIERIQGNSSQLSVNSDINQRNTLGTQVKQLALLVEADYLLVNGLDLKFMYDFFDPNTDLKSGTAARYSGGVEFMPMSGVEVRPMFRYTKDTIIGRNTTDLQVLFHLYL